MRFAVTGSTGFLGNRLVRLLRHQGHEVTRILRPNSRVPDEAQPPMGWDPDKGWMDRDGLEGMDAVIHLGGVALDAKPWTPAFKKRLVDSRVIPTDCLARGLARLEKPPQALICVSAAGYYGPSHGVVFTEQDGPGEDFLGQLCRQWEAAAEPARQRGIRVVHARLGVVLSPEGAALKRMLPAFRFGLGGPLGSGRQPFCWISLDDALAGLSWLARNTEMQGPVNLAAPGRLTQGEFAKALGSALSRPAFMPVPAFALRFLFGEMADAVLLAGQHLDVGKLRRGGFRFRHSDIETALAELFDRPRGEFLDLTGTV